jgi:hypothetical protein
MKLFSPSGALARRSLHKLFKPSAGGGGSLPTPIRDGAAPGDPERLRQLSRRQGGAADIVTGSYGAAGASGKSTLGN